MWRFGVLLLTLFFPTLNSAIANPATSELIFSQVQAQRKVNAVESDEDTEQLLKQLNATPQQQQRMQDIRTQYQNQISQHRQQLRQAQEQLQVLLSTNANPREIRQKHDELLQVKQEMNKLQFEMILQIREVLTPEQRRQFADIMEQRRRNRPRSNPD